MTASHAGGLLRLRCAHRLSILRALTVLATAYGRARTTEPHHSGAQRQDLGRTQLTVAAKQAGDELRTARKNLTTTPPRRGS